MERMKHTGSNASAVLSFFKAQENCSGVSPVLRGPAPRDFPTLLGRHAQTSIYHAKGGECLGGFAGRRHGPPSLLPHSILASHNGAGNRGAALFQLMSATLEPTHALELCFHPAGQEALVPCHAMQCYAMLTDLIPKHLASAQSQLL